MRKNGIIEKVIVENFTKLIRHTKVQIQQISWTTNEIKRDPYLDFCSYSITKSYLTAACQPSLSFTMSQSWLKCIELVMLSNHLILCCPLLLLPLVFPSIRVFSNESTLHIRWPKYWSFSFSISPSNKYSELISLALW